MLKSEIRKHIKELIKENISTLANQSQGTCKKIVGSEEYSTASEVFAYMALPDEVDLSEVIKQALKDGKKVALPKILSQDEGIMEFFYLDPLKTLLEQTGDGAYGILEPDVSRPASLDKTSNALILVPGRAFTKDGDRLGRGKGYYDRYLGDRLLRCARNDDHKKRLPNVTIAGVCFSFQVLPEVPTDLNDVKMDVVFTTSQE